MLDNENRGFPFPEKLDGEEMETLAGGSDSEDNSDAQSESGHTDATVLREERSLITFDLDKEYLNNLKANFKSLKNSWTLAKSESDHVKLRELNEALIILTAKLDALRNHILTQSFDENYKQKVSKLHYNATKLQVMNWGLMGKLGKSTLNSLKDSSLETTLPLAEDVSSLTSQDHFFKEGSLASTTNITQRFRDLTREQSLVTVKGSNGSLPTMDVIVRGSGSYEDDVDTSDFTLYAYRDKPVSELALMKSKEAFQYELPPAMQLTSAEQKSLRSEGLKAYSPTGQVISFHLSKSTFKAVLKKEETLMGENEEVARLKNALSLITMINNVREKCENVHVETADPFLAQIANMYFLYLDEQGISMQDSTAPKLSASSEQETATKNLFETHFLSAFDSFKTDSPQSLCLASIKAKEVQTPRLLS